MSFSSLVSSEMAAFGSSSDAASLDSTGPFLGRTQVLGDLNLDSNSTLEMAKNVDDGWTFVKERKNQNVCPLLICLFILKRGRNRQSIMCS